MLGNKGLSQESSIVIRFWGSFFVLVELAVIISLLRAIRHFFKPRMAAIRSLRAIRHFFKPRMAAIRLLRAIRHFFKPQIAAIKPEKDCLC